MNSAAFDVSNVQFRASITSTETVLRVRYEVRNPNPWPLALFNRLAVVEPDHSFRFPPEAAYVDVRDDRLELRKGVLELPVGLQVPERPLPYVMQVEAEGHFEETCDFALPIPANQPFTALEIAREHPGMDILPVEEVHVSSVTFLVDVFAAPATRLSPLGTTFPGIYRLAGPLPTAPAYTTLGVTSPLRPPAAVLAYRPVARIRREE